MSRASTAATLPLGGDQLPEVVAEVSTGAVVSAGREVVASELGSTGVLSVIAGRVEPGELLESSPHAGTTVSRSPRAGAASRYRGRTHRAASSPNSQQPQAVPRRVTVRLVGSFDEGVRVRTEVLGREHVDRSSANATDLDRPFLEWITDATCGATCGPTTRSIARPAAWSRSPSSPRSGRDELALHLRASTTTGVSDAELAQVLQHVAHLRRRARREPRLPGRQDRHASTMTRPTHLALTRTIRRSCTPTTRSTRKRSPTMTLIAIVQTLSEVTGPGPVWSDLTEDDADLTTNAGTGGEAIGQRTIITGRVLDENGNAAARHADRDLAGQRVRALHALARGRLPGPTRSELPRRRAMSHERRRRVPLPHGQARPVSVGQPPQRLAAGAHPLLADRARARHAGS